MNTGKKSYVKTLSAILLLLLLLGLASAAVLASRIGDLTKRDDGTESIPIGDNASKDTDGSGSDATDSEGNQEAELVFKKDLFIFKTSYNNENGEVTVLSGDGRKVVAPGTSWSYKFSLENVKDVSLNYSVSVQVIIEGTEILEIDSAFPVQARMKGPADWLRGEGGAYVPVAELDGLKDNGVLASGNKADYRLTWKWPFESGEDGDSLDTLLGDLSALKGDVSLTIRINIYATDSTDPDEPGGEPIPPTGDDFSIGLWLSMMIISFFVFVAVLSREKRKLSPVQQALAAGRDDDGGRE